MNNSKKNTTDQSTSKSISQEATTASPQVSTKKFNPERYEQVMRALGRVNKLTLPKGLDTNSHYYRYVSARDPIKIENLKSIGYEIVTKPDGSEYREFASVNDEKKTSGRIDYVLMRVSWEIKEEIEKYKMINRGKIQAQTLNAAEIEEKYYTEEKQGERKGDKLHDSFNNKYNPNNYKFF